MQILRTQNRATFNYPVLPWESFDVAWLLGMEFERAGNCVCEHCGQLFSRHPYDMIDVTYDGIPSLVILCDGSRVKL